MRILFSFLSFLAVGCGTPHKPIELGNQKGLLSLGEKEIIYSRRSNLISRSGGRLVSGPVALEFASGSFAKPSEVIVEEVDSSEYITLFKETAMAAYEIRAYLNIAFVILAKEDFIGDLRLEIRIPDDFVTQNPECYKRTSLFVRILEGGENEEHEEFENIGVVGKHLGIEKERKTLKATIRSDAFVDKDKNGYNRAMFFVGCN